MSFFLKNKVLYQHQFGFRKNHSTSLALLEMIDSCYKNLDQGNIVLGIFFDLQKAFDTVNHDILLRKLYHYGIRGVMHNWIKDYLTNRHQFTVVNGVSSEPKVITCGVPQGSVLGPLFFLIYINDISNAVEGSRLRLFADDTNLFLSDTNLTELEVRANSCLKKMEDWFLANRLSLNASKTSYSLFFKNKTNINKNVSLTLKINNVEIPKVNNYKYLGVTIDDSLKWDLHVDCIYKKIVKFTGIFYKLRNTLPSACLIKLYFAFVHPSILYGIEVYANASQNVLDKLCKLNNKLIRIILNKKMSTPIMDLYRSLNILPIPLLHEMSLLVFVFKFHHQRSLMPDIFHSYFEFNNQIHSYNTRCNSQIHLDNVSSNFGQRMTAHRACKMWNSLSDELKTYMSISSFKKTLKTFMYDRAP
jgi:hypothetical protein